MQCGDDSGIQTCKIMIPYFSTAYCLDCKLVLTTKYHSIKSYDKLHQFHVGL